MHEGMDEEIYIMISIEECIETMYISHPVIDYNNASTFHLDYSL